LVGQGKHQTAHQLARSTLLLALCIALFYVPLLTLGTQLIASAYTKDAAVIAIAVQLLKLAAIFQVADVLQVTAISGLRGFHDTRIPMLIILLSFWGIAMPLGYVLTFTNYLTPAMGAAGFWLALIAGLVSACVLLLIRLFRFRPRVQSSH
jgi:MATE family multidrug resistance protein